jgi:hypothetical protein
MYWGEGAKTTDQFKIADSDPRFLGVICAWLDAIEVDSSTVQFKLQYYQANGLTEEEIVAHWVAEIPYLQRCGRRQGTCVVVERPSQKKGVGKCLYGTCTIYLRKARRLFNLVMGGIEYLCTAGEGD